MVNFKFKIFAPNYLIKNFINFINTKKFIRNMDNIYANDKRKKP